MPSCTRSSLIENVHWWLVIATVSPVGDAIRMTVGPSYPMASLIQALEHATGRAAVAEGSLT